MKLICLIFFWIICSCSEGANAKKSRELVDDEFESMFSDDDVNKGEEEGDSDYYDDEYEESDEADEDSNRRDSDDQSDDQIEYEEYDEDEEVSEDDDDGEWLYEQEEDAENTTEYEQETDGEDNEVKHESDASVSGKRTSQDDTVHSKADKSTDDTINANEELEDTDEDESEDTLDYENDELGEMFDEEEDEEEDEDEEDESQREVAEEHQLDKGHETMGQSKNITTQDEEVFGTTGEHGTRLRNDEANVKLTKLFDFEDEEDDSPVKKYNGDDTVKIKTTTQHSYEQDVPGVGEKTNEAGGSGSNSSKEVDGKTAHQRDEGIETLDSETVDIVKKFKKVNDVSTNRKSDQESVLTKQTDKNGVFQKEVMRTVEDKKLVIQKQRSTTKLDNNDDEEENGITSDRDKGSASDDSLLTTLTDISGGFPNDDMARIIDKNGAIEREVTTALSDNGVVQEDVVKTLTDKTDGIREDVTTTVTGNDSVSQGSHSINNTDRKIAQNKNIEADQHQEIKNDKIETKKSNSNNDRIVSVEEVEKVPKQDAVKRVTSKTTSDAEKKHEGDKIEVKAKNVGSVNKMKKSNLGKQNHTKTKQPKDLSATKTKVKRIKEPLLPGDIDGDEDKSRSQKSEVAQDLLDNTEEETKKRKAFQPKENKMDKVEAIKDDSHIGMVSKYDDDNTGNGNKGPVTTKRGLEALDEKHDSEDDVQALINTEDKNKTTKGEKEIEDDGEFLDKKRQTRGSAKSKVKSSDGKTKNASVPKKSQTPQPKKKTKAGYESEPKLKVPIGDSEVKTTKINAEDGESNEIAQESTKNDNDIVGDKLERNELKVDDTKFTKEQVTYLFDFGDEEDSFGGVLLPNDIRVSTFDANIAPKTSPGDGNDKSRSKLQQDDIQTMTKDNILEVDEFIGDFDNNDEADGDEFLPAGLFGKKSSDNGEYVKKRDTESGSQQPTEQKKSESTGVDSTYSLFADEISKDQKDVQTKSAKENVIATQTAKKADAQVYTQKGATSDSDITDNDVLATQETGTTATEPQKVTTTNIIGDSSATFPKPQKRAETMPEFSTIGDNDILQNCESKSPFLEIIQKQQQPQCETTKRDEEYEAEFLYIKQMINERKEEYEQKIVDLEVQVLRLQNQVLVESLNKTDRTAVFSKLENQILKLENELLRLNHSFHSVKVENDKLKQNQQSQANDLALVKETTHSQSPALPDYTSEISETINRHQSKLNELIVSVRTQEAFIKRLESHAEEMNARNREIELQLMNQSLVVAQLMARIDGLVQSQLEQQRMIQDVTTSVKYQIQERDSERKISGEPETKKVKSTKTLKKVSTKNRQPSSTNQNESGTADESGNSVHSMEERKMSDKTQTSQNDREGFKGKLVEVSMVGTPQVDSSGNGNSNDEKEAGVKYKLKEPMVKTPLVDTRKSETVYELGVDNMVGKHGRETDRLNDEQIAETPQMDTKTAQTMNDIDDNNSGRRTVEKRSADEDKANVVMETLDFFQDIPNGSDGMKTVGDEEHVLEQNKEVNEQPTKKEDIPDDVREVNSPPKPLYEDKKYKTPKDCFDHYLNGRKRDTAIKVNPKGSTNDFTVWCDMKNGGWTVIQRRLDGRTDFYRGWKDYKNGFGDVMSEHWLGLENIHLITNQGYYSLRIDMTNWDKQEVYAQYDIFLLEDEKLGYRLYASDYSGTAKGDALVSGIKFSTKDVDNDLADQDFGGSCAKRFHGAWWYHKCYKSNLNGKYYKNGIVDDLAFDGVSWKPWTGPKYSLKKVEMKIRPKNAEERLKS